MKDNEWRNINLEMQDFAYRLSKLNNPYVKEEAKATILDDFKQVMINRNKRLKIKD